MQPARWHFTTPADRGAVQAEPASLSPNVLDLPDVDIQQGGIGAAPRLLQVFRPDGSPQRDERFALRRKDHDTIYPRLKRIISSQDLERVYTPDEGALAAQAAQDDVAYLGFLNYLKTFQRLEYFVRLPNVLACIVQHITRSVERTERIGAFAAYDQAGTSRQHQARVRAYRGVKPFREGGHELIRQAIAAAAIQTEQLADLINLAIEELLRHSYELPDFTTLVKIAKTNESTPRHSSTPKSARALPRKPPRLSTPYSSWALCCSAAAGIGSKTRVANRLSPT